MPDREKVIKGLECCMKWTGEPNTATCHCSDCSYTNMDILGQRCLIDLINDALALLKEQQEKGRLADTAKVKTVQRIAKSEDNGTYFTMIWYECEECGHKINGDDIFCAGCGKEVDRSEVKLDG